MKANVSKKILTRAEKAKFKRKWGVKPDIFNKMFFAVADWKKKNKASRGRKSELTDS